MLNSKTKTQPTTDLLIAHHPVEKDLPAAIMVATEKVVKRLSGREP